MEKTIRVYCVLFNCDGPGRMGDGLEWRRFRKQRDAEDFAEGRRCYAGPATVTAEDVPRKLAQRWGLA